MKTISEQYINDLTEGVWSNFKERHKLRQDAVKIYGDKAVKLEDKMKADLAKGKDKKTVMDEFYKKLDVIDKEYNLNRKVASNYHHPDIE